MIFFLMSFSLSLLFSMFLVTNLMFYTLSLLILTLSLLLLMVASSYVYGLTSIMVAVVYVGAMMILIGYICAICPNIYTSVLSLKSMPYVLSSPLFLLTFLSKEFSQTPSSNIDLSLLFFLQVSRSSPVSLFIPFFIFVPSYDYNKSLSPQSPFSIFSLKMIKMSKPFSPFLPIQASLWPLCVSLSIFAFFFSLESWIITGGSSFYLLSLSLAILGFISFLWFKDLSRESMLGYHTHKMEMSLRVSMLLFILSEIFFFFSFFWAFFDSSLSPVIEIGMQWPPLGISPLPIFSVPLLNTIILLSSGATVTLAHHSLMNNYYKKSLMSLLLTVILGIYFLSMQWLEYDEAPFSMSDSVYGSTFFMATGFHGFHVLAGTSYLFLVLISIYHLKLTFNRHFMFESAAWYWHFVDVVWLFLFVSIYWWGSL